MLTGKMGIMRKLDRISKRIYVFGSLFFLSGCDMVPTSCEMIYCVPHEHIAPEKSKFYNNIELLRVWGGGETNCENASLLQDIALRCALEKSLECAHVLSPTEFATYSLEVEQVSLDIRSEGTFQQVRLLLRATLKNSTKNVILFNDIVETYAIATYQEAMVPASRIRIAIEKAAKGCIEKILEKILL